MRHPLLLLYALCCLYVPVAAQSLPPLIPFTDGDKWGFADSTGRVRIPLLWDEVRPFRDGHALVALNGRPASNSTRTVALIDSLGRYIISPEAGWDGVWAGWSRTGLNARDSAGRWGLVDDQGTILLPFRWEGRGGILPGAFADSFRTVALDGRVGVIDRRGAWIVPPRWSSVTSDIGLAEAGLFMVEDPAYGPLSGENAYGLVDVRNRQVLPAVFRSFRISRLEDGLQIITATAATRLRMRSESRLESSVQRTFRYPAMTEFSGLPVASSRLEDVVVLHGRSIFGSEGSLGIRDRKGAILVPQGQLARYNQDTLWLVSRARIGEDSVLLTRSILDARTLQPLTAPKVVLIYEEDFDKRMQRFDRAISGGYSYSHPREISVEVSEGVWKNRFYKDSFQFRITRYATSRPADRIYVVHGTTKAHNRLGYGYECEAVIDSNFNYLFPPTEKISIIRFNPDQHLIVVFLHGGIGYGHALLDLQGQLLTRPVNAEIADGFRWNGNVYAIAGNLAHGGTSRDGRSGWAYGSMLVLVDSSGAKVPAFAGYLIQGQDTEQQNYPYHLSGGAPSPQPGKYRDADGALLVSDSSRKVAFLLPDGSQRYPALSFHYEGLTPFGDWFLAYQPHTEPATPTKQVLVDRRNKPVSSGLIIYMAEPLGFGHPRLRYSPGEPVVPRLYKASAIRVKEGKKTIYCILDDRGRVYYKPATAK